MQSTKTKICKTSKSQKNIFPLLKIEIKKNQKKIVVNGNWMFQSRKIVDNKILFDNKILRKRQER